MRLALTVTLSALLFASWSEAQTTQGLISGRVLNSVTGRPVAGAQVTYSSSALSASGTLRSDITGYYFLPQLSAGTYSVRVAAAQFQPQELQNIELPVAGRIQLDFRMRPLNDVWEAGQYRSVFLPGSKTIVTFYGPDVDSSRSGSFDSQSGSRGTLDTSMSYVVDPSQIEDLPLLGRDVYTMLVSLPAVNADNGTGRGLGISVAGQRPSSSNYLLDGVENDNYLVTGPLNPVAPEAVQEYRISTNNYSAEYGRTSGFVANAVTRAGGSQFHGVGYWYLKNDALNAADFADNMNGYGSRPDKENQYGFQIGGPVRRSRKLYFSSALERDTSHSYQDPQTYVFPTSNFIPALNIPTSRLARQLLTQYAPPLIVSQQLTGTMSLTAPVVVNRLIALERGDYTFRDGRDHLMARLNIARLNEPDFLWNPYSAFTSGLYQNTTGIAGNWQHSWSPRVTSEFKLSYSDDNLWWDRAHPEVPTLVSGDGVLLPGSTAFYAYRNHNKSFETIYSTVWTRNKHVIAAGAGLLNRFNSGYLTAGRDGEYLFSGIVAFAFDQPNFFRAAIDRLNPTNPTVPDFNRNYRDNQWFAFVQDSYRVTPHFTLNLGIRYEQFGAPMNTGSVKDDLLTLGNGSNFNAELKNATLSAPSSGNQAIWSGSNGNFAPRFGFSWDPLGKSKTVIHGGFGLFYDRPFDNLWQNVRANNVLLPLYTVNGPSTNYLAPINTALQSYKTQDPGSGFPGITLIDPKLRSGYSESFFLGIQQSLRDNLTLDLNTTGALGRRLISTDVINRQFTDPTTLTGRPNEALGDVSWRSSQGLSDYYSLNALVRYRMRNFYLQTAYTWSHAIDNQSDPLIGDFFDLNFTTINSGTGTALKSTFASQYNSNGDRGNSDFDQRHNLFFTGVWTSTGRNLLTRGWQVSGLAAFRSGFPFTVRSVTTNAPATGNGVVENQRADLIKPGLAFINTPVPGGVELLNPLAFAEPLNAALPGNTGRNAFRGPGLYSMDLSLSRRFSIPKMKEGTFLTLRADAFNFLNHANLGNPDSLVGSPTFGLATYGRQGTASGFPAVSPLNETARQIQLLLRLTF